MNTNIFTLVIESTMGSPVMGRVTFFYPRGRYLHLPNLQDNMYLNIAWESPAGMRD